MRKIVGIAVLFFVCSANFPLQASGLGRRGAKPFHAAIIRAIRGILSPPAAKAGAAQAVAFQRLKLEAASRGVAAEAAAAQDARVPLEMSRAKAAELFERLADAAPVSVDGNGLTLLTTGGDTFRSMLEAIDSAEDTVHLETYIFTNDPTGYEFARRLAAKARSGVSVSLIFDAVGSRGIDSRMLAGLREAGVEVLEYHPVAPWRQGWAWNRRDHRKILVVDGRVGFAGGVNILHEHASIEDGGSNWSDTHVRVEGPAAYDLDQQFREVWTKETGRPIEPGARPKKGRSSKNVEIVANQEFAARWRIRRTFLRELREARREVLIKKAYFIPDRRISRALAEAARRGVEVKVLVPALSDSPPAWYAGRREYHYLLKQGVRLFEWSGPMLHDKTYVIDRERSAVGSYNEDHRSLLHNLEINLHVRDRGFGSLMGALFDRDLAQSREITLEQWSRRSGLDKFLEKFCSLFKYLL